MCWGATPEDWSAAKRIAKEHLLPVVSNPHAVKSERSKMKGLGKTPSLYIDTKDGPRVIGFTDWTENESTVRQLDTWAAEPDYGICIQTKRIRALDIDVPDQELSGQIAVRWAELLEAGEDDPAPMGLRYRADSGNQLLAFIVEGELSKRSFVVKEWQEWDEERQRDVTKRWIVEFLADGQQFIAAGTHPKGQRYQWAGGKIPAQLPSYSANRFDRAWRVLVKEFALEGVDRRAERRDPSMPEDLEVEDPVAEHLIETWPNYGLHKGMLLIDCPWKGDHSSDNGETETAWMLAGTGKYRNGHFACRHAGCAEHSDAEFLHVVEYRPVKAEAFDDLTLEADPELDRQVAAYIAQAPGASAKTKELKAERARQMKLPLPGFNRDNSGRIETSLENITRALMAVQACAVEIAFDTFRGELMLAAQPGQWEPISDAWAVDLRMTLEALGFKDKIGKELMRDALEWVGDKRQFDSAQEWLTVVVPAWDGVSRIHRFFPDYLGTEDTPYTRACGDYAWTAHAGRILEPGIKADMVPVLVGPQGARKSSGIAAISPHEDFFAEFDLEASDEDKARKMRGTLVGELAELRGLQTRDRESILAWIVRRFEKWTPKYKEYETALARRLVLWGSSNDDEFLGDPTGERRWLPNTVVRMVDVDAIVRDRMQLWAEARDVFGFEGLLFREAERLARAEHGKYKAADAALAKIALFIDTPGGNLENEDETPRNSGRLTANEVLIECLGVPASKITKRDQMRVGGLLAQLGMVKTQRKVGRHNMKVWVDKESGRL